jgi:hypothetical protein
MSEAMATRDPQPLALRHELSVDDMIAQVTKIQHLMKLVMRENEHYGVIPGTGTKPTLLKPGAEKLCFTFRLDPQYEHTEVWSGDPQNQHLRIASKCTLWHIPTGQRWGSGEGSCSTREKKYAWRTSKRECPKCGAAAIVRSQYPPRTAPRGSNTPPGWWCNKKGGGCGADFYADDPLITAQEEGTIENPDLADQHNTVLKMANKRALVAAVLNVTAASDIFTQDLEDLDRASASLPRGEVIEGEVVKDPPAEEPAPPKVAPRAKAAPKTKNEAPPTFWERVEGKPEAPRYEPDAETLFPQEHEIAMRAALNKEAMRIAKIIGASFADREAWKQTYLRTADITVCKLSDLIELVNFLRARVGEPKWGEEAPA